MDKIKHIRQQAWLTIKVGSPIVAAQLLQMSMGFVDTVMAGNLTPEDLAAVSVGNAFLSPIYILVIGVVLAINPIVAQLYGAGKLDEIGDNILQGLWLSQILALPSIFILRNLEPLMVLMNIEPKVVFIITGYLQALTWGIPAIYAYSVLRFFNEGISVTKPSMYFALIGSIINIAGNYVFMYGHFGFPALGAIGTGWSTALVWWVIFSGMFWFTYRNKAYKSMRIFGKFKLPSWRYIKEILGIGIPNGLSISMEISLFALVTVIIGGLGVVAVAGHAIALNFAAITFMVPLGLSIATTARVGQAIGKSSLSEAKFAGYVGIGLCFTIMCIFAILMWTLPDLIVSIYTQETAVKTMAVQLLYLAAIFQVSDGLQVGGLGALRGLKDTKIPMIVNFIAYWAIGMTTAYYLGITEKLGPEGLWIGLIIGLSIAAVLHNVRFYYLTNHIKNM